MNQIEEREALATELEAAEKAMADMQAELGVFEHKQTTGCDFESGYRLIRSAHGRHAELLKLSSEMTARVESLRDRLKYLDEIIAYQRHVTEAPNKAQVAKTSLDVAEKQCAELEARAENLRQRVSKIRAENSQLEEQAATAETKAAQKYAAAICDAKTEKSALAEVQRVQAESAAIRARIAANAPVSAAIEAEIAALKQRAGVARAEAEEHKQEMFSAMIIGLEQQWDAAVGDLVAIGVRLTTVCHKAGYGPDNMWKLYIPRFGPETHSIGADDLRHQLTEEGAI